MSDTARSTTPGGEKWLDARVPCLDKGFIVLKDYMGGDAAIVQAARVSYGAGTKRVSDDKALIAYLMRHHHTTPFEMVELKFLVKLPIFVARQWIRHRTANVNEISARYTAMEDDYHEPAPEAVRFQSTQNRQGGSSEEVPPQLCGRVLDILRGGQARAHEEYEKLLEDDIARELARIHLPVSLYTQWYWKIDLHNLLHFLQLRMDEHAQYEIRVYANAIAGILKDLVPWTWEAFEEFRLGARSFSRSEMTVLGQLLRGEAVTLPETLTKGGRRREFEAKLRDLGIAPDRTLPE